MIFEHPLYLDKLVTPNLVMLDASSRHTASDHKSNFLEYLTHIVGQNCVTKDEAINALHTATGLSIGVKEKSAESFQVWTVDPQGEHSLSNSAS